MIFDKISNRQLYFRGSVFDQVFAQLLKYNCETPDGVYKNHDDFYFKVMSYDTRLELSILESHKKEVDIQILLAGNERIKIFNANDVVISSLYDEKTDCQYYRPIGTAMSEVILKPEFMAVFFPDDIHNPQLAVEGMVDGLKKIVIKINEKFFTQ